METNDKKENKNKQRFKGVENFLRRIAFNLGNTPSQTEVKIISCIPIDVTDLQQKIIQLERQLDEIGAGTAPKEAEPKKGVTCACKESSTKKTKSVNEDAEPKNGKAPDAKPEKDAKEQSAKKCSASSQKKTSVVSIAFCDSNFNYSSTNPSKQVKCEQSQEKMPCRDGTSKQGKSTVSFIFPALSDNYGNCMVSSDDTYDDNKGKCRSRFRKNLFNIKKKIPKKKKYNRNEIVYYAETDNSPFKGIKSTAKNNNSVNRAYLNDMFQKQYNLGMILEKLSQTTEFSSPICRDDEQTCRGHCLYESDVCSCCHGPFQDIDYETNNSFNQSRTYPASVINDRGIYYDSSLYDVIPVKENPVNYKKNIDFLRRKEENVDIKCWPDVPTKLHFQPYLVNYHTVTTPKEIKKPLKVSNNRELKDIIKKRDRKLKLNEDIDDDTSNSCSVNLGEVQIKRVNKKIITKQLFKSVQPLYKNAECLTTTVNNTDCQAASFSVEDSNILDKTEEILNNIKNILQSVLAEVKTISQMKQSKATVKKDAGVQKGVSQSNMQGCSRLLNCLTYSPFNMNPYVTTYSRQMPTGNPCCSIQQHPMKCMHKCPIFIQSASRRKCASCFRSSQIKKCHPNNVTTATNTDEINEEHGRETEKLIKEIYYGINDGFAN